MNCQQTNTPVIDQLADPCGGEKVSTKCIFSEKALAYLELPINATLEEIIDALIVKMEALEV